MVAISNMADFVSDNGFRFVTAHILQQTGTHGDQRSVAARAGGEGVDVRGVINRHLRHGDACLLRLLCDGVHQPTLSFVTRLFDNFPTNRLQRHPFRHQQRNDRAAKTKQQRHDQQAGHAARLDPRQAKHQAKHHHDCQVSQQEKRDSHHNILFTSI